MTTQAKPKVGFVMLEDVRIAFVHSQYGGLWRAGGGEDGGRPAYSSSFILTPDHKSLPAVRQAMLAVARHKWGPEGDNVLQALAASGRTFLINGNVKGHIAGYAGNWVINARSPVAPLVIDQNRQPLTEESGIPYSGCYVNAALAIWAQQNKHGRRINAQLRGVQFVRHGEPLGGGAPASVDEFGDIEESAMAANEFGALFGGQQQAAQDAGQPTDFSSLLGSADDTPF
jgi:hypothetical protein